MSQKYDFFLDMPPAGVWQCHKMTTICHELVDMRLGNLLLGRSTGLLTERRGAESAEASILALRRLMGEVFEGKLIVTYEKKRYDGTPWGRLYPRGPSMALLPIELRHTLCRDRYVDVDMVNAHPTLLRYFCRSNGVRCPAIDGYVEDRERFLEDVSGELGVDRKSAKEAVLAAIYGGQPRSQKVAAVGGEAIAAANAAANLFPGLAKTAMQRAEERKKEGKGFNPVGTLLGWVLGDIEAACLLTIKGVFEKEQVIRNGECILAFDGLMVPKPDISPLEREEEERFGIPYETPEERIRRVIIVAEEELESLYNGLGMRLAIKAMDGGFTRKELVALEEAGAELRTEASGMSAWSSIRLYNSYEHAVKTFEERYFFCFSHSAVYEDATNGPPRRINLTEFKRTYGDVCYRHESGDVTPFLTRYMRSNEARMYADVRMVPPPEEVEPEENVYNTWKGFAASRISEPPNPEGVEFFRRHIYELCNGEAAVAAYLEKYLAHLVQRPGELPGVVILIRGIEGCGKGLLYSFIEAIIGQNYAFSSTNATDHVFGRFSDHLEHRFVVLLDEMELSTAEEVMHKLKGECVAERRTIECKGVAPRVAKNYTRYLVFSNKSMPMAISASDRRMLCIGCRRGRMSPRESEKGFEHLRDPASIRAIYDHLLDVVNLEGFDIRARPLTSYYETLVEATTSLETKFFRHLLDTWKGSCVETFLTADLYKRFQAFAAASGVAKTKVLSSFTQEIMTSLGERCGLTRPGGAQGRSIVNGVRGCAITIDFLTLGRALGLVPVCEAAWAIYCKGPNMEAIDEQRTKAMKILAGSSMRPSPHGFHFHDVGDSTEGLRELLATGATGVYQAFQARPLQLPRGIVLIRTDAWTIYSNTREGIDRCIAVAENGRLEPLEGKCIFMDACGSEAGPQDRLALQSLLETGATGVLFDSRSVLTSSRRAAETYLGEHGMICRFVD
jgi:hypothetical protein